MKTIAIGDSATDSPSPGRDSLLRRAVLRCLARLQTGRLTLVDDDQTHYFGQMGDDLLAAVVVVRDRRFYRMLVFGGSMGAAEAYIRGYWNSDNLTAVIQLFARNAALLRSFDGPWTRLATMFHGLAHRLRRNTHAGSRRNIAAHYDLGNEFFRLFLDETMAYSCAIFPHPESSLAEASRGKFDRICRKLELGPDDHLLEIGTGWGGLAIHAARHYGCRVTTTTISQRQYEFAAQQVAAAGLSDRVRVLRDDYRDLEGSYDKLASIEMIEAVGYEFFDAFFRVCSERLKPDGMMLLQAIIMPEQNYARYRRSTDFMQRYIFPGGCLPSLGAICESVGRATDFRIFHLEDISPHYAETLARWRAHFVTNLAQIRDQGFDDEFLRTWELYFCYCEGAFRQRVIGDVQMLLTKPQCRRASITPPLD